MCVALARSPRILAHGRGCLLLEVKRTSARHCPMSAFDPKRTLVSLSRLAGGGTRTRPREISHAPTRSVRPRAVDHFLERNVFFALGAADQAHLLEVVLGLEEVALFGMPHAVIGPGQSVFGIGGKRLVVPIFGVVIAAQLAARIAEQRRYVGIVVVLQGAERGDAALIIVFVVNQCISGMITV